MSQNGKGGLRGIDLQDSLQGLLTTGSAPGDQRGIASQGRKGGVIGVHFNHALLQLGGHCRAVATGSCEGKGSQALSYPKIPKFFKFFILTYSFIVYLFTVSCCGDL